MQPPPVVPKQIMPKIARAQRVLGMARAANLRAADPVAHLRDLSFNISLNIVTQLTPDLVRLRIPETREIGLASFPFSSSQKIMKLPFFLNLWF